ncbi:hypothetical protein AB0H88_36825 [Nonomuraea sp. NPDC050680]|uniref:SbtR family transcriptional regulator n=1 Tax=Nonomuraea sp. NPDC050680 TaxID=3154630 RepID=UPI0033CB4339
MTVPLAGVGIGTLYRNFPAREALAEAAAEHRFAEMLAFARTQAGGTVRADATTADVYLIVCALAAVIRNAAGDWRRFIEIILNGLGS